ncbi:GNAT family N-acetyltransferase [Paenibacillus sp. WLX1005]|uniref:GNAT family N-acetyltransferase n=1 Tax=Paenibacillus sp. WLX1005 TaxID=3243766 RepID=UPI0039842207
MLMNAEQGIVLVGVEDNDKGFLLELYNSPTVVMNALEPSDYPISAGSIDKTVAVFESGDNKMFIVKVNGERAGMAMLYETSYIHQRCKYGLVLTPEFVGKKVGTYVTELILQYCFNYLNLRKVSGEVHLHNQGAMRLIHAFGFEQEGVLRDHVYREGEHRDMYMYSILKSAVVYPSQLKPYAIAR